MYASIILAATVLLGSASAAPLSNVVRAPAPAHVVRTTTSWPAYWNTSGLTNTTAGFTGTNTSSSSASLTTGVSTPSSSASFAQGAPLDTIYPAFTSQYNAANGAVDFHTARGYVSRNPKNGGADISTLLTFMVDKKYADRQCQVVFDLKDASSTVSGSKKVQLFTSIAPATADSKSWPSGNLRDDNLGALDAVKGGRATWQAGSGSGASTDGKFACSKIAGKIFGGEVVPQGDDVEFSWPAGKDGVKIVVY